MKNYLDTIQSQIKKSTDAKLQLLSCQDLLDSINQIAQLCVAAYQRGNKIIWAGNGGSAADAQHMSGELVSKFYFDRPGLASIALTTDTSIITAIGNDYGYEALFSRQLQANGEEGDIFIGLSTSGNSKNLVKAFDTCKEKGITAIAIIGNKPSLMDHWDISLKLPSDETPRIQEMHTLIGHILCCIIEEELFSAYKK